MECPFCSSLILRSLLNKNKNELFFRCDSCNGISRESSAFLSFDEQKKRYDLHNNNLTDLGYLSFLIGFIKPTLYFLKSFQEINDSSFFLHKILDFGSGPSPELVKLLKKISDNDIDTISTKKLFSDKCEIRGWDPIFAPNTPFFENGADLVTCLEVVEHFEKPCDNFQKLSDVTRKGGFVAIGTMLVDEINNEQFMKWWYKSDLTHVSFYSKTALIICCQKVHLDFVAQLTPRLLLFRKK